MFVHRSGYGLSYCPEWLCRQKQGTLQTRASRQGLESHGTCCSVAEVIPVCHHSNVDNKASNVVFDPCNLPGITRFSHWVTSITLKWHSHPSSQSSSKCTLETQQLLWEIQRVTILYLGLVYVSHSGMIHLTNKFISSWSSDIIQWPSCRLWRWFECSHSPWDCQRGPSHAFLCQV